MDFYSLAPKISANESVNKYARHKSREAGVKKKRRVLRAFFFVKLFLILWAALMG